MNNKICVNHLLKLKIKCKINNSKNKDIRKDLQL
jgi:hypothetical protein